MCHFASLVLTKDSVFWSKKTDSHEDIIKEFDLHEGSNPKSPNILRVELLPRDGDPFSDPATWAYKVDQDLTPKWHDKKADEKRARAALLDLVAARVFIRKSDLVFDAGEIVFVKDSSRVEALGSSSVVARGSSSVEAMDSSRVVALGSSSVETRDSSCVVKADDHATVRHYSDTAPCKPTGPHAVVIDSRGGRLKCVVGK